MGGYDLYGRYYKNSNDAINAEVAQCNEIDNRHNQRRIDDLHRNEQIYSQYIEHLYNEVEMLKRVIAQPLHSWYLEQVKQRSI